MPNRPVRVAVVDDHPMVLEGTISALAAEPGLQVVGSASDGEGALRLVSEYHPDVLVLDLHLPDMSGVAVARQLYAEGSRTAILVITGYDHIAYQRELAELGVNSILGKEATAPEIAAAVRALAAGKPIPVPAGHGLGGSGIDLTVRQHEVLALLSSGQRNPEIGGHLGVGVKTVEFHVSNILAKLRARSRVEAILKAQQAGLLPGAPASSNRSSTAEDGPIVPR